MAAFALQAAPAAPAVAAPPTKVPVVSAPPVAAAPAQAANRRGWTPAQVVGVCSIGGLLAARVACGRKQRRAAASPRVARLVATVEEQALSEEDDGSLKEDLGTEGAEEAAGDWGEAFSWRKAWYPMAVLQDMDWARPTKLELLGESLVAWKDGDGEWRVFEDRCPHRNVPLSEGRVESDGTLMCSYHGWRFSGEGKLTALPQATDEQLPRLQANPRSCASARPTQIRNGVLWVWGESGPDAALESALVEPNCVAEMEDPELEGRASMGCWSHRDVPYGWEVALENVTDPAHVDVAHHNIVSNRYTSPGPIAIDFTRKPTNKGGFKFRVRKPNHPKSDPDVVSTMDFKPPTAMHIRTHFKKTDASLTLIINFVPTKPGWTRLVGSTLLINGKSGEKPPGFAIYSAPLPRWLTHILGPAFLHQDQVFLHHQQAILEQERKKSGVAWDKSYWIPTQADKGTVTLRRWLDKNGGVDWSPAANFDVESTMPDNAVYETYRTHTQTCEACKKALKRTERLRKGFKYGAIIAGAAGVASSSVGLMAGGLALGVGSTACGQLRKMFYEFPFNHQDNK